MGWATHSVAVLALTVFTLACGESPSPHIGSYTWSLNGLTFDDGGTATGTLTVTYSPKKSDTCMDCIDIELTDWNIEVTGGNTSIFPEFNYSPDNSTGKYTIPCYGAICTEFRFINVSAEGQQRALHIVAKAEIYADFDGTPDTTIPLFTDVPDLVSNESNSFADPVICAPGDQESTKCRRYIDEGDLELIPPEEAGAENGMA